MCMSAYRANANLAVLRLLFSPGSQGACGRNPRTDAQRSASDSRLRLWLSTGLAARPWGQLAGPRTPVTSAKHSGSAALSRTCSDHARRSRTELADSINPVGGSHQMRDRELRRSLAEPPFDTALDQQTELGGRASRSPLSLQLRLYAGQWLTFTERARNVIAGGRVTREIPAGQRPQCVL